MGKKKRLWGKKKILEFIAVESVSTQGLVRV
jgi:hypothetical protein